VRFAGKYKLWLHDREQVDELFEIALAKLHPPMVIKQNIVLTA
jgi:hypothetical protein